MEKINGVTMDGHTVVDIDRNADEVVIPEYAKDTTYQLPLYGINSMEVSDLMLLAQFAGLPKRLVLNDKGNLASYSLSYWSGVNAIDSVLGRAGLEWLELTDDNPYFKTVDGILYSKDGYKGNKRRCDSSCTSYRIQKPGRNKPYVKSHHCM